MASIPQTYTISDFVEWNEKNQLELAPAFQRGSVWTTSAQGFLIDTILRGFPIPQIYLRTKIVPGTQTTLREVVDGQQRLRAILDFAAGRLRLGSKSGEYAGMRYSDLPPEAQEAFLSFQLTTVQLLNASDADVLEVFARLNSYSVKVTPAELRHAKYSEPVKWAIWESTRHWSVLWETYRVVSLRESVRLRNTSVIADLYMMLFNGLGDGGEDKINKFYHDMKSEPEEIFSPVSNRLDRHIERAIALFGDDLAGSTFFDSPNFIVLVSALAFLENDMPPAPVSAEIEDLRGHGVDAARATDQLRELSTAMENDDIDGQYGRFVTASRSSTQRIASRKIRLEFVARALAA